MLKTHLKKLNKLKCFFLTQNNLTKFFILILLFLSTVSLFRVSLNILENILPSHTNYYERFCCTPSPIVFSSNSYINEKIFHFSFQDDSNETFYKYQLVEKIDNLYFGIWFRHYFQILGLDYPLPIKNGLDFFFCQKNNMQIFFKNRIVKNVTLETQKKSEDGKTVLKIEKVSHICK